MTRVTTRVAIAGLGAIGRVLARGLANGMPGLALAAVATRGRAKAQTWLDAEGIACPLVEPEAFPDHADIAIECAPSAALERICRPMLEVSSMTWLTFDHYVSIVLCYEFFAKH